VSKKASPPQQAAGLSGAGALFFLLFVLFLSLFAANSGLTSKKADALEAPPSDVQALEKIALESPHGAVASAPLPGEWSERSVPAAFELRDIFVEGEGRVHPDALPLIKKTKAQLASSGGRVVLTIDVPRESASSTAIAQLRLEAIQSFFADDANRLSAHLRVVDTSALANGVRVVYWASRPRR
jgi:hypothetical protein